MTQRFLLVLKDVISYLSLNFINYLCQKDFRARRNSDLILQEAVPGLCFYTQFCDRHGRIEQLYESNEQPGANLHFCARYFQA